MVDYNKIFKKKKKGMSMSMGKAAIIVGAGAGLGIGMAVAYKMKDTIKENVLNVVDKVGSACGCSCQCCEDDEHGYKYYIEEDEDSYNTGFQNTMYYRRDRVNKRIPKGINGVKRNY